MKIGLVKTCDILPVSQIICHYRYHILLVSSQVRPITLNVTNRKPFPIRDRARESVEIYGLTFQK